MKNLVIKVSTMTSGTMYISELGDNIDETRLLRDVTQAQTFSTQDILNLSKKHKDMIDKVGFEITHYEVEKPNTNYYEMAEKSLENEIEKATTLNKELEKRGDELMVRENEGYIRGCRAGLIELRAARSCSQVTLDEFIKSLSV